ncbi:hypothetical protein CPB84DRAFT_318580 [Gymnopilus junonius]|uniref:Cytochrome c oxidase assembly protein COX20, mitochondrial n=1 Tax=Gymnopilus junonius TaxID=109634 RepID=A0A9P5NCP2_GYMJU|nr:hypothetical protein CPB84DRAFT_318580 [Gymnopilus junonius]
MTSNSDSTPQTSTLPSRAPPPTGNLIHDSIESAKHVSDLPCARNALLAGIASGAGMGVIRGMTAGPMMAGHWAMGTFALISLGSWCVDKVSDSPIPADTCISLSRHICQKQYADERKRLTQVIERMPRRTLKESDTQPTKTDAPGTSKS